METLGSLIDKLTIVNLKQLHTHDEWKRTTLKIHSRQLVTEINEYISDVLSGQIPREFLYQPSHKVHIGTKSPSCLCVSMGEAISQLTTANNGVWHMQEKVYDFRNVPTEQKDEVIEQLAVFNLQRTKCIDEIDRMFKEMIGR